LQSKIEREKAKCEKIEERLEQIDAEYKEFELDYKKLVELDAERETLEEELMSLYEALDSDERELALNYSD
ncbi:MAG: hypothetical protein II135_08585, partial [Clostridia bacterium]|nr:hypothetical protein [Clostridia bacterium]